METPTMRRPALREVEHVGDVDQHFPREVLGAGRVQGVERGGAVRAVEDELAVSRRVRERHRVVAGRARADEHVVAELAQLPRDRRAHDSGSENADPHELKSTIALVTEIREARAEEGPILAGVQERASVAALAHIFPPERYPYPREAVHDALGRPRSRSRGRGR